MKVTRTETLVGRQDGQSARERKAGRKVVANIAPRAGLSPERLKAGVWAPALSQRPEGRGGIRETMSLHDLAAMGGGAGLLYKRGSLSREQFLAASWLRSKAETASATGRSASDLRERVDGGRRAGDGGSAQKAFALAQIRQALEPLSSAQRKAVEAIVFREMTLAEAAKSLSDPAWDAFRRAETRGNKVKLNLSTGLDLVATFASWKSWT